MRHKQVTIVRAEVRHDIALCKAGKSSHLGVVGHLPDEDLALPIRAHIPSVSAVETEITSNRHFKFLDRAHVLQSEAGNHFVAYLLGGMDSGGFAQKPQACITSSGAAA